MSIQVKYIFSLYFIIFYFPYFVVVPLFNINDNMNLQKFKCMAIYISCAKFYINIVP